MYFIQKSCLIGIICWWLLPFAYANQCTRIGSTGFGDNGIVSTLNNNSLIIGSNSTINNQPIVSSGNATSPTGPLITESHPLPPIDPASFPSFSASNNITINGSSLNAGTYNNVTISNTGTLNGGIFYIKNLTTGNNDNIQFAPGTYYIETIQIGNSNNITISPTGVVRIYIKTAFEGGNELKMNSGGSVGNLQVFLYNPADFQVGNGNNGDTDFNFVGFLYAPGTGSNIQMGNNNQIRGSIIGGGVIQLGNNIDIVYSTADQAAVSAITFGDCGPDHLRVYLDNNTNALTCSSRAVSVIACDDASCSTRYASSDVSVTLNPNGTAATIPVNGTGTPSVSQTTAGITSITLNSSTPTMDGSIPFRCYSGTVATSGSEITGACNLNFSSAGFFISVPNHVSCTTQTLAVMAAKASDQSTQCVPAFDGGAVRTVNLRFSYINPTSGTTVPTIGSNNPPTSALATGDLGLNMTFNGGVATTNLRYADAGSLAISASYTGSVATGDSGLSMSTVSNPAFVVAPANFVFSGIPVAPLVAGKSFNITTTAKNSCNGDTPNFGQETPSAATATLVSSNPLPSLGNATPINQTLSGFINGAKTSQLNWGEVGLIDLTATTSNYLASSLSVVGTQSSVGRFRPDHFDVAITSPSPDFVYAGRGTTPGQPFTVTVTAKNDLNKITMNYDYVASYAKPIDLTLIAGGGVGKLFIDSSVSDANDIPASKFINGVASVTYSDIVGKISYVFDNINTPTAPTPITLHAEDTESAPSDGENDSTIAYFGRLRLFNAFGSEKNNLSLSGQLQYWSGNSWITNHSDNATSLPSNIFSLSGTISTNTSISAVTVSQGLITILLTKPNPSATGSVDMTANLTNFPWLRSPNGYCATYNCDPSARATFGIYSPETKKTVHIRELY